MNYITMICDIKNSKNIEPELRIKYQYKIIDTLKECNKEFKNYIASSFLITTGDEWQGLLYPNAPYMDIIKFFKKRLKGLEFYTGIGIGPIIIHDFELTINQLDGTAFHSARKAVKLCKKQKSSFIVIIDSWEDI